MEEVILGTFGIIFFIRGVLFHALQVFTTEILSILLGIVFAFLRKKHNLLLGRVYNSYYVKVEGLTSLKARVKGADNNDEKTITDQNRHFELEYDHFDNEDKEITVTVINLGRTKENNKVKAMENLRNKKNERKKNKKVPQMILYFLQVVRRIMEISIRIKSGG